MWYKSPFWLDLLHVTGHIECDHLHYDRSWYWILQHNSTWWKVGDNFCCQSGISGDTVSERESTASGASAPDDKTTTIQYKPATSLTGNNNALANYEQSHGYNHLSHVLSNFHGLYRWSCNLLDIIFIYSLNLGKLPGRFSYEWPGYKANPTLKSQLIPSSM